MKKLLLLIFISGCASAPEDTRICIEYQPVEEAIERCKPFYGSLICTTERTVRQWCTLYAED